MVFLCAVFICKWKARNEHRNNTPFLLLHSSLSLPSFTFIHALFHFSFACNESERKEKGKKRNKRAKLKWTKVNEVHALFNFNLFFCVIFFFILSFLSRLHSVSLTFHWKENERNKEENVWFRSLFPLV